MAGKESVEDKNREKPIDFYDLVSFFEWELL